MNGSVGDRARMGRVLQMSSRIGETAEDSASRHSLGEIPFRILNRCEKVLADLNPHCLAVADTGRDVVRRSRFTSLSL